MSTEALSWVLNHSPLKGQDKLVLLGVANHADPHGRNAWPSLATLAIYASVSVRTVQRVLQKLVDGGHLRMVKNAGGGPEQRGDRRPNLYEIVMNDTTASCHPAEPDDTTTAVTPKPLHGVTKTRHGVTKTGPRGDSTMAHKRPTERPTEQKTFTAPSADASAPAVADELPLDPHPEAAPTPPADPTQTLVGAYVESVEQSGGIAIKEMRPACGSWCKRTLRENPGIEPAVLLLAVQRAGAKRQKTFAHHLGTAQQAYNRPAARQAMFAAWDDIAARLSNSQQQIGA